MKVLGATFDALRELPIVREFLDSFHKATGARIELVSGGASAVPSRMSVGGRATGKSPLGTADATTAARIIAVPITIRGEQVATFVAAVCDRRADGGGTRVGGRRPPLQLSAQQRDGVSGLLRIFAELLSECAGRYLTAHGHSDPPGVKAAKEFIQKHSAEPITSHDAARHVHRGVDQFRHRFSKATGMSFTEYLSRVRVENAKELIADRHKQMTEVAHEVGFESVSHFNRVFKAYAGMSPTKYRESLKGQNARRRR